MPTDQPARLVVLAAGNGSNLQAIFDAIDARRLTATVALVVSHRPEAYALVRAQSRGVPTQCETLAAVRVRGGTRDDFDRWLAQTVERAKPDLVVCAGWMLLLGEPFLKQFGPRTINLHPALPGAFVGKDAIGQAWRAAQRGDIAETGVMVHDVILEMDAGTPIAVKRIAIAPGETLEALTERVHAVEHTLLIEAIALKLTQLRA